MDARKNSGDIMISVPMMSGIAAIKLEIASMTSESGFNKVKIKLERPFEITMKNKH